MWFIFSLFLKCEDDIVRYGLMVEERNHTFGSEDAFTSLPDERSYAFEISCLSLKLL